MEQTNEILLVTFEAIYLGLRMSDYKKFRMYKSKPDALWFGFLKRYKDVYLLPASVILL